MAELVLFLNLFLFWVDINREMAGNDGGELVGIFTYN